MLAVHAVGHLQRQTRQRGVRCVEPGGHACHRGVRGVEPGGQRGVRGVEPGGDHGLQFSE